MASSFTPGADVPARYARVSGDDSAVHLDEQLARSVGLPGVILHGMYLFGLVMRAASADVDADPRRVRSASARFTAPAVPGSELSVCSTAVDGDVAIRMSQRGVDVLTAQVVQTTEEK
jgi:acyl dehydratase